MTSAAPALDMRGVSMRFGRNWVLRDVDFSVHKGSIHALVGHNGAGKSTLMKLALGALRPTRGDVYVDGTHLAGGGPAEARRLGLGMVLQERSLISTISGLDNLYLNSELTRRPRLIDRRRELAEAEQLCARLGLPSHLLRQSVDRMSTIEQELLEIAKAVRLAHAVLILDEPTAPLGRKEIETLFTLLRRIASLGTGIILITHHMTEVFAISDRVTCLRAGRVVQSSRTADTNVGSIIAAIVDSASEAPSADQVTTSVPERLSGRDRTAALDVVNLTVTGKFANLSFQVMEGEILGVAGLAGTGRSSLLRVLFGDRTPSTGKMQLHGRPYRPRSPRQAIRRGVYLIPENRATHGLMLAKSLFDNVALSAVDGATRYGIFRSNYALRIVRRCVAALGIVHRDVSQPVYELSGGNQQKLVFAKAVAAEPRVWLLDEPTTGVDVGAAADLLAFLRREAESGKPVLIVESDLLELSKVADRVLVLGRFGTHKIVTRDDHAFTEAGLLGLMDEG